jgi:hypothetical protein
MILLNVASRLDVDAAQGLKTDPTGKNFPEKPRK